MNLLEKLLPSLRRSPAMAQLKKDIADERRENMKARNRVLAAAEILVEELDIIRAAKREQVLAKVTGGKNASSRKR
jgi:hypothetical protein